MSHAKTSCWYTCSCKYFYLFCSTFNYCVPFLSFLAIICLSVVTIVLYFIPLRYLIMAWGINKFTKKLRAPDAINNNELLDFLSRLPDNDEKVWSVNEITLINWFNKIMNIYALLDYVSRFTSLIDSFGNNRSRQKEEKEDELKCITF